MDCKPSPICTELRFLQPEKAYSPILVTPSGISKVFILVQPSKAFAPMVFKLFGNSTWLMLIQFLNAFGDIVSKFSLKNTVSNAEQLANKASDKYVFVTYSVFRLANELKLNVEYELMGLPKYIVFNEGKSGLSSDKSASPFSKTISSNL